MFDIGFSELLVVGVVALVVIGPERLPKVARTAGVLLGRMQRYVQNVKADISREMQLDELKKLQAEMQESARNFEQTIASEVQTIGKDVSEAVESAKLGRGDEHRKQPESNAETQHVVVQDVPPAALSDDSSTPAKTGV
jgi:sec-independent protein translocase protein TatB